MSDWVQIFIDEAIFRMCDESAGRIRKCLGRMTADEIWTRPNKNTVSAGNLVLHLCGNVRQYIISGLGGAPDERRRDKEFSEKGPVGRDVLVEMLDRTLSEARAVLTGLSEKDLLAKKTIQGFELDGLAAVMHVVEHFSYHTGQIGYILKSTRDIDLNYYGNQDLNIRNE